MKKTLFIIASIASIFVVSCTKEQVTEIASEDVTAPVGVVYKDGKTYLTINAPEESKVNIVNRVDDISEDSKRTIFWEEGDKLAWNGVASDALDKSYTPGAHSKSATFTWDRILERPAKLFTPANFYKNYEEDPTIVTLPETGEMTGDDNIVKNNYPMCGTISESGEVTLNPLCAIVRLQIKGTVNEGSISKVEFSGRNEEQIWGDFKVDYTNATLTSQSTAAEFKKVTVTCSKDFSTTEAKFVNIIVPAGTYKKGFQVKIYDNSGKAMVQVKKSETTLTAGKIVSFPELNYFANEFVINSAEELVQFAKDYNDGKFAGSNVNPVVKLGQGIVFDKNTSAEFVATGGIGTNDDGNGGTNYFNGIFDGNNHTISGLKATVPLFAYVGANGRIEYLTLTETCSFDYSSAIAEDKSLGSIAGYSEGDLFNCVNKADVSCSSARTAGVLNIGGVVGRQYATGTISNCANYGSVTCTVDGSPDIYMGGIAGTVERPSSGHTALIKGCVNYGDVKNGIDSGEPAQSCFLHIGGVVGWIYSTSSSANMEISGLINTGNVTKTNNSARADAKAVLVGGIVGGIHGASISDKSGTVAIKNSHVMNCRVQTGSFNNKVGYGEASHVGGFVAVARGNESSKNISFSDDCYVKDVYVICRRGFAGGFVSWARGAVFSGCHVLSSSVRGSLANCYFAGGIAGCAYDCNLSDCIVLLTKEDSAGVASDSYTLFAQGNNSMAGGIVAQARGTVSIDRCKAYVKNIVQGESGKEAYRGWIIGYIEDDAGITIKDCAIGGASTSATTITLDADNFDDDHNDHTYGYFYGSKGTNGTVIFTGTQTYWEAIKTADITIASYAKDHDWVTNNSYSIEQGDVTLTPSDNGAGNPNGVYNTQWRFYQARGGGLTISVSGGHTLVRAKFAYTSTNNGVLLAPDGATRIASGGSCNLSGTSAFFTLGNTGGATNGQVRFTEIVVEYTNSPFINK